jgi:ribonuclease T2
MKKLLETLMRPRLLISLLAVGLGLGGYTMTVSARDFDYYTFALSLSPAFCDQNPQRRDSLQCRERLAVSVHGLWPEKAQGRAPANCRGAPLALSPAQEKNLRGIMPDAGLRRYQWDKHGRCSGLAPAEYFALVEREFMELKWPPQLQSQGRDVIVERQVVLREFHRLNPGFPERGVMLRCDSKGRPPLLQEIRVCLTPEGKPAECAANFRPNCPTAVKIRGR